MRLIQGNITAAQGFEAAGEHIGIKSKKKDFAIVYSQAPCQLAGAFTQNVVKAAPVHWNKAVLEGQKPVHAIAINSGNANTATGLQGQQDVADTASGVAEALNIQQKEVLVCSTGVIGERLPMDVIKTGIPKTVAALSHTQEGGRAAADAILTTDLVQKTIAIEEEINGVKVTIGGMGKGSGMIHPNMATLLSFITTDANISQAMLQKALSRAIETSFNMITVDGDTSTNDTVLVLANGLAGGPAITKEGEAFEKFYNCLCEVCRYLAVAIVRDGEGATKLLEVDLTGAKTFASGKAIAKSILTSNLVKTAFFGEDANWGRILCAMGYAGVPFDPQQVAITLESGAGVVNVLKEGLPVSFNEQKAKRILEEKEINIIIHMGEGNEKVTAWGCDLSYDYVKINGDYRS